MEVLLRNQQRKSPVDSKRLKELVRQVLEGLDCTNHELSVLLVSDAKIRELNRRYRDIDRPTDVLSFPQQEGEEPGLNPYLLGDVVVSAETAQRQAREHHLSLEEELILLLIHGILHLLGCDHERSAGEARKMKQTTRRLFRKIFPGREPSPSCDF